jgi:hypothetical protein
VPLKEHNQQGFYLCPKTAVYRRETKKSLKRTCLRCNDKVKKVHTESPHRSNDCPSIEAKGTVLRRHESFRVESISGWERYKITDQEKKFTPKDVTLAVLEDLKRRYKPIQKIVKKPNFDSINAARMMAPGIHVVYQIERKKASAGLPWGMGVCNSVNKTQKSFEVSVLEPTALTVLEAPWSTGEITKTKKVISFADPSWMKVNNLTRKQIPNKVLHAIWKEKKFDWQWISVLDSRKDDVSPADLEFAEDDP